MKLRMRFSLISLLFLLLVSCGREPNKDQISKEMIEINCILLDVCQRENLDFEDNYPYVILTKRNFEDSLTYLAQKSRTLAISDQESTLLKELFSRSNLKSIEIYSKSRIFFVVQSSSNINSRKTGFQFIGLSKQCDSLDFWEPLKIDQFNF
jgi:hypothetical protein